MWLNLSRVGVMKTAVAVLMGVSGGTSSRRLSRGFFDAVARDEAEVDELEFNTNAARREAAILGKYGIEP